MNDLNWSELSFGYIPTDYNIRCYFTEGKWGDLEISSSENITMHMADALISPTVGLTMIAVTAGIGAYSSKKIENEMDDKKIPLMGVMGAFVFATQMINFTIPATGSSGHLGGGILLAALLGPYAGFLTMAPIAKIATCGCGIIGVPIKFPKLPMLEMV